MSHEIRQNSVFRQNVEPLEKVAKFVESALIKSAEQIRFRLLVAFGAKVFGAASKLSFVGDIVKRERYVAAIFSASERRRLFAVRQANVEPLFERETLPGRFQLRENFAPILASENVIVEQIDVRSRFVEELRDRRPTLRTRFFFD